MWVERGKNGKGRKGAKKGFGIEIQKLVTSKNSRKVVGKGREGGDYGVSCSQRKWRLDRNWPTPLTSQPYHPSFQTKQNLVVLFLQILVPLIPPFLCTISHRYRYTIYCKRTGIGQLPLLLSHITPFSKLFGKKHNFPVPFLPLPVPLNPPFLCTISHIIIYCKRTGAGHIIHFWSC